MIRPQYLTPTLSQNFSRICWSIFFVRQALRGKCFIKLIKINLPNTMISVLPPFFKGAAEGDRFANHLKLRQDYPKLALTIYCSKTHILNVSALFKTL